jgi:hypothetical protein
MYDDESANQAAIEVRVEHLAQLFDRFDLFPAPSRDLARSAEDFIVGWARELPRKAQLGIVVHVPSPVMEEGSAGALREASGATFLTAPIASAATSMNFSASAGCPWRLDWAS